MAGDIGEISLRTNCLRSGHFGGLNTGGDTGIPAGVFAANGIVVGDLATSVLQYVDVTIPTASVLALNTTPYQLVAAPGSTKAIIVTEIFASLVYAAATYSCNASGAALKYTDGSGAAVGISLTQAFVQTSSGTALLHVRGAATALVPVANAKIVIQAVSTDPTTGDSAIKIRTYYRVVTAPLS